MSIKEVDYMEYASDGTAQATYVTNASQTNISNASIDDEDMTTIIDWSVSGDAGNGATTQVTFDTKSCMKMTSGNIGQTGRIKDIVIDGTVFSLNLYCDQVGTIANSDQFEFNTGDGTIRLRVAFCSDGLFVYNGAAWVEIGVNLVTQDAWQEWTFKVDWTAQTVDVYLGGVSQATGVDCSNASASNDHSIYLFLAGDTTPNNIVYVDWEKTGSDFFKSLQSYSELTIKTQGSYALKGVAIGESIDQSQLLFTADVGYLGDDGGVLEYRPGQGFKLSVNSIISAIQLRTTNVIGSPTGNWTIRIETDNAGFPSGTLADVNASVVVTPATAGNTVKCSFSTPFSLMGSTQYHIVVLCDNQSDNNRWEISAYTSSVYADGTREYYDGTWHATTSDCYFIIYTLPALNKTLTRTVSPTIDLSGMTLLKYDIRSNRTGSNIKIGLHDSGGTTTETTANILSANTYQTESVDISSVADANKNAIDSVIITQINADAETIYYIDNMYASTGETTTFTPKIFFFD